MTLFEKTRPQHCARPNNESLTDLLLHPKNLEKTESGIAGGVSVLLGVSETETYAVFSRASTSFLGLWHFGRRFCFLTLFPGTGHVADPAAADLAGLQPPQKVLLFDIVSGGPGMSPTQQPQHCARPNNESLTDLLLHPKNLEKTESGIAGGVSETLLFPGTGHAVFSRASTSFLGLWHFGRRFCFLTLFPGTGHVADPFLGLWHFGRRFCFLTLFPGTGHVASTTTLRTAE